MQHFQSTSSLEWGWGGEEKNHQFIKNPLGDYLTRPPWGKGGFVVDLINFDGSYFTLVL